MSNVIKVLTEKEVDFYPATVTDAVGHDQFKCSLTDMLNNYNLNTICPKGNTSSYTLMEAINLVEENLLSKQKKPGIKIGFTGEDGNYEEWEYFNSSIAFNNSSGWRRLDSSIINEIEAIVFPVTVDLRLDTQGGRDIYETKKSIDLTFSWTVYRRGIDVTKDSIITFNGANVTGNTKTIRLNHSTHTIETITVSATYQEVVGTETIEVKFVDPTYYGLVDEEWQPTSGNITSLPYPITVNSYKYVNSLLFTNGIDNKKVVIAVPTYLDDAGYCVIKDMNGLRYDQSFSYKDVVVDGVQYTVATMINPTTIDGEFEIGYYDRK